MSSTNAIGLPIFPRFDGYVCAGDSVEIQVGPLRIRARIVHDPHQSIDDDDVHKVDDDEAWTGWEGAEEVREKCREAREAWFRDEWFYCGVVLDVLIGDTVLEKNAASLWGIEANYPGGTNAYLSEVADELTHEALDAVASRIHETHQGLRSAAQLIDSLYKG